jgi:hypothetical protein
LAALREAERAASAAARSANIVCVSLHDDEQLAAIPVQRLDSVLFDETEIVKG